MFFMQAALARMVVKENAKLHGQLPLHPDVMARFRLVMKLDAVVGLAFVVSALPVFWVDTPVGFLRFYISAYLVHIPGPACAQETAGQGRMRVIMREAHPKPKGLRLIRHMRLADVDCVTIGRNLYISKVRL
jgi:hypothetical protein